MKSDILLIDDDPIVARIMIEQLASLGPLRTAGNSSEAMAQIELKVPELILLDMDLPGTPGIDLCGRLKLDARLAQVPVIFVTGNSEPELEAFALELGASDFIVKPTNAAILRARVTTQLKLTRVTRQLQELAMTDTLTGLANRRNFEITLRAECRRAHRTNASVCLLVIDVDYFKAYNDQYGHPAGDECLRQVTRALAATARRPGDMLARYGGEEFVALLPQTDREGGLIIAEAMLAALRDLGIPHAGSTVCDHVTVSIGVSCLTPEISGAGGETDPVRLLAAADAALYDAKESGRAKALFQACAGPSGRVSAPGSTIAAAGFGQPKAPTRKPATSIADWPEIVGIDSEQAQRRLCGNLPLFASLLHRLVNQFGGIVELDGVTETSSDLARNIHKLKGSSGTLGAMKLYDLALRTELALNGGNQGLTRDLLSELSAHMLQIRADCAQTFENWHKLN